MLIAGYAVGAAEGLLYVRDDNPAAWVRAQRAVDQARQRGLLGSNVLGAGIAFDVTVRRGAGGFVAGEASAVVAALAGRPAEPSPTEVRLAEKGLQGRPTLVTNVETLANVPLVFTRGPDAFKARQGKVVTLTGAVAKGGLREVPLGVTLRDLVDRFGGGVPEGETLKALQIGGPSGGFLPASLLDRPLTFEGLADAGQILGNGVVVALGRRTCIVDQARSLTGYLAQESCGKCTPCREGLQHLTAILDRLCAGTGEEGDLELLEGLAGTLQEASLCAFGATAANPVLTGLRYFREEFEAHLAARRCPGAVCKALIEYRVNDRCTGCTLCALKCPVQAITGPKKGLHVIDRALCTRCGVCFDVCKFDAVEVE